MWAHRPLYIELFGFFWGGLFGLFLGGLIGLLTVASLAYFEWAYWPLLELGTLASFGVGSLASFRWAQGLLSIGNELISMQLHFTQLGGRMGNVT